MGLSESKDLVNEPQVQDIDLSAVRKQRFRVDGDNNRILELNVSDMGIITRLEELTPKLEALQSKAATQQDGEEEFSQMAETLKTIDGEMRHIMDDLFNANVSEVCAPDGSMFDPFQGKFRFEHIIDTLMPLYEKNIADEYKKMSSRISKHAGKYTKKSEKK